MCLDTDRKSIAEGKRLFGDLENLEFVYGNAVHLLFARESFDCVIALYVLNLVPLDQIGEAMKAIQWVLKREGQFFANLMTPEDPDAGYTTRQIGKNYYEMVNGWLMKFYEKQEVEALLGGLSYSILPGEE